MTTISPVRPATAARPSRSPSAAADRDMDALLDMLEERAVDPPSVRARARSIATAATPRAAVAARRLAAADRRAAHALSVAALLVLVSLMTAAVVSAETAARAVAGWDLPTRARSWSARARAWTDRVLAWPARVDHPI